MCGIVGHQGTENSINLVLSGLHKLEYRGYDSAGISFIDENHKTKVIKEEGRLVNLANSLRELGCTSESAIGHTRWATHGKVSRDNSHPHSGDGFTLVHNGIIENFNSIREDLGKSSFKSQTDTEVFAKLIDSNMKKGKPFLESISESFQIVKGNSAFVILEEKTGDIYAIRRNAPLVLGVDGSGENKFVSSDPYALNFGVDCLYFPDNDVICHLKANSHEISFFDLKLQKSTSFTQERSFEVQEDEGKGKYEHYMLKEIFEQPLRIRNFIEFYQENVSAKLNRPDRIYMTACGTAYYASLVIRDFLEKITKIPTIVEMASEFRYRDPLLCKNDLAIFVSQSGETADTLAALDLCRDRGLSTLAILNVINSSMSRHADVNFPIKAGVEIGVASTKAFTLQVLTGRVLVDILESGKIQKATIKKISLLSKKIENVLNDAKKIEQIAEKLYQQQGFFFTGRGDFYPAALEGALKLKEIAYVHAEGYASGELKHGPIALIDSNVVNIAYIGENLFDKTLSNIQEIKARRGKIFTIGEVGGSEVQQISDYSFELDFDGLDELSPVLANVVGQLFSYYIAKFKGTDIDKPRNLAKSVTVE